MKTTVEITDSLGYKYKISPYDGTLRMWQMDKCFAFYCSNRFFYIVFTKSGKARMGYCPHMGGREKELLRTKHKGTWIGILDKGKIKKIAEKKSGKNIGKSVI